MEINWPCSSYRLKRIIDLANVCFESVLGWCWPYSLESYRSRWADTCENFPWNLLMFHTRKKNRTGCSVNFPECFPGSSFFETNFELSSQIFLRIMGIAKRLVIILLRRYQVSLDMLCTYWLGFLFLRLGGLQDRFFGMYVLGAASNECSICFVLSSFSR